MFIIAFVYLIVNFILLAHPMKIFDIIALSCYYIHCRYRMNSTFSTEPIAWIEILVGQITQDPRRRGGCIPSCRRTIQTNKREGIPSHFEGIPSLLVSILPTGSLTGGWRQRHLKVEHTVWDFS